MSYIAVEDIEIGERSCKLRIHEPEPDGHLNYYSLVLVDAHTSASLLTFECHESMDREAAILAVLEAVDIDDGVLASGLVSTAMHLLQNAEGDDGDGGQKVAP